MYSLQRSQSSPQTLIKVVTFVALASVISASLWVALFVTGALTLGGVPYTVLLKFWQDDVAREAFINGDGQALHDRLGTMGVEYEIKKYYRSRISDPVVLDQHIHQILYDRTGYLGESYTLGENGRLILKDAGEAADIESCPNC